VDHQHVDAGGELVGGFEPVELVAVRVVRLRVDQTGTRVGPTGFAPQSGPEPLAGVEPLGVPHLRLTPAVVDEPDEQFVRRHGVASVVYHLQLPVRVHLAHRPELRVERYRRRLLPGFVRDSEHSDAHERSQNDHDTDHQDGPDDRRDTPVGPEQRPRSAPGFILTH
jgi:hypothetical protein